MIFPHIFDKRMSSSDSNGDSEECSTCGGNMNVNFCYGCRCDYCNNCSFHGGCGVCDAEKYAWEQFDDAMKTIKNMNPPEKSSRACLQNLLAFMEYWKRSVACCEDDIVCMCFGGGGTHDGSIIMTDCGDSVLREMEWYIAMANMICKGNYIFDTIPPQ